MNYVEKEIKILEIDPSELIERLILLGAREVFNGQRIITHFDHKDLQLTKKGNNIKLTEEAKLKVSIDSTLETSERESIKFTISRKEEFIEFLKRLDIYPITQCVSQRISFELEGVDFDIDTFPQIHSFLEFDTERSSYSERTILEKLNLQDREMIRCSTPEVYRKYGLDYFDIFKI